jgi:hypothetical protein
MRLICHTHVSELSDDGGRKRCFDFAVNLNRDAANELIASISVDLVMEPYRERLTPLAHATLSGASQQRIEESRELVLAAVWDERLRGAVVEGIRRLRSLVEAAEADIAGALSESGIARAAIDRVLFELLQNQEQNETALEALEEELRETRASERASRARRAMQGAGTWTRIPRNEIRAAIVRSTHTTALYGSDRAGAAEESARRLARLLATNARRESARAWVAEMADVYAASFPLLAEQLRRFATQPRSADPGHDPVWLEACIGLVVSESLRHS